MDPSVGVIRTHWTGTSGGPGLTQLCVAGPDGGFAWTDEIAQDCVDAVRAFWDTNKNTLPNEITLTVDPNVDKYAMVTGALMDSYQAATAPASVTGTNTGSYSMPSGLKVALRTNTIANNRRVRGAIFVVPCAGDVFDASGSVSSTPRTGWVNAANTLKTALTAAGVDLIVWSRPTNTTSNDGGGSLVSGFDVPTKGAILRSRRD
jgi:hypothetical protein